MCAASGGYLLESYDICVIGGGINGTGVARDAAGRGLSVLLLEAGDLGGATSSASTKLIHGGLRYLEHYEFRLVAESLAERETLLKAAPHLVRPQEFILPHDRTLRPVWMIRAGLFLYDHLKSRSVLPGSRMIPLGGGDILNPHYKTGFSYHDCWGDDARLVVANAIDAAQKGAHIRTRSQCHAILPVYKNKGWRVGFRDLMRQKDFEIEARSIVNATGPWVREILARHKLVTKKTPGIRLVKGSHIILPKLYEGGHAYIMQQPDRRFVFAIPYERHFTLIGTTDVRFEDNPAQVKITTGEIDYLCAAVNRSFQSKISSCDIVWSYSGVRALAGGGEKNLSAITRDYKLHLEYFSGSPILSVFGGKLTTYRRLSEQVMNKIAPLSGNAAPAWTKGAVLPGGNIVERDFKDWLQRQAIRYSWLPAPLLRRYAQSYGARMDIILSGAGAISDLGVHYGDQLYEAEVAYLVRHEWARTSEDILWRRSKMGLHVKIDTVAALEQALPKLLEEIS